MTDAGATGAAPGGAGRGLPPVALAAALVTLIFWSGTVVANRAAVESIDGLTVGALRSMLAGFIGLGIAMAFRLPLPKRARHRWLLVISGWVNFAIWPTVLSLGVALANASHAALIMALLPVTTGLIAAIVNRVRPRPGWWLGAAIAIAGTVLLIAFTRPAGDLTLSPTWLVGDLVVFAGVCLCSAGYVAGAKLGPVVGSWSATFYGLGAALMLTVPAILILYAYTDWSQVTADSWFGVALAHPVLVARRLRLVVPGDEPGRHCTDRGLPIPATGLVRHRRGRHSGRKDHLDHPRRRAAHPARHWIAQKYAH